MPYNEEMDMRYMNQLVKEVNAEEVIPEERLTDQAYLISFLKRKMRCWMHGIERKKREK